MALGVKCHANETKPRVGGQIRLGFSNEKSLQQSACQVSPRREIVYQ